MSILKRIKSPDDLKKLTIEKLCLLASEIRDEIIKTCARTGGHVAPSLGVVELTLALYRVFDAERDKIIWDVGHQTYAQKLITGRYERFRTLRTYKGISGFPKRSESRYDFFDTGHSSTSISAGAGFAIARDLNKEDYQIISVIGDGAIGAGMAYEALNYIGQLKTDFIIILNDNERSIGESVGALSEYLTRIITTRTYNRFRDDTWIFLERLPPYFRVRSRNVAKRVQEALKGLYAPSVIFEELGFRYIGPLNGHRLDELCDTFSRVKQMKGPRFVHIVTKKGKGYKPAEKYPELFHGIGPYDVKTGRPRPKPNSYTNVFGDAILRFARKNKKVVVITAGMRLGTGLKRFSEEIPARFFDVGICEQHAVTMAAALSLEGYIPVCAIYSTFLQRAYDQIIHDVCLQNLPVIFVLDRAGLVGEDGPTHHGPFDISYFRAIPNIIISAPMDGQELVRLLKTAISYRKGPFVIRYPKSSCEPASNMDPEIISIGKWEIIEPGKDIAIIAIGSMVKESLNAVRQLKKRGLRPILINGRFAKPLDYNMLRSLDKKVNTIFTVEENSLCGGFGSAISEFYRRSKINIEHIGVPDRFIKHGSRTLLLKNIGLTATEIANTILAQL